MDKWRRRPKSRTSFVGEDSLLPPSLLPPSLRQPAAKASKNERRTIDGFLKKVSAVLEAQASASSSSASSQAEDLEPAAKLKAKCPKSQSGAHQRNGTNCQSARSSDGSLAGRRGKVKARVEARRVEQLRGDSSLDESGLDREPCRPPAANKRSRASRTERYLKRMCNGGKSPPGASAAARARAHDPGPQQQRPVPGCATDDLRPRPQHDITDDNFYARHTQVGVNPLVQQTLRYFSEFDCGGGGGGVHRPPTPPSRDHTSRLLLDKYQGLMPPPPPRYQAGECDDAQLQRASANPTRRAPAEQHVEPGSTRRGSSKNLEEALSELEAIYKSLQLGDEELLDRAERRTMEEFLYKGLASSPDGYDGAPSKTWLADPSLDEQQQQQQQPDRLRDDMAYRRMHPKERPNSADAQSLSGISYLMTSPVPCPRRHAPPLTEPTPSRARRREPDVTLDDVVFRNMHYAKNTLKVLEPQPPFGIPLGPITAAADSDYLHSHLADWDRARSPRVQQPCRQPDLVTDDLAFRSLRKDAQPSSSRQSSPCFPPSTPSRSPRSPRPPWRDARAASCRSSVDLYGSASSQPTSPEDLLSVRADWAPRHGQRSARRISEPDAMPADWQRSSWRGLHGHCRGPRAEHCSDADPSDDRLSSSCSESSDGSVRPVCLRRSPLADGDDRRDREAVASDGRPSSSLSSVCGIPPPPPPTRSLEPFTEHELSVYKQLCRDLENLVQLTQTSDSGPHSALEQSVSPSLPEEGPAASSSTSSSKVSLEDAPTISATAAERSPTKREISSILDSLKSLREDSQPETAAGTVRQAMDGEPRTRVPAERTEDGGGGQVGEKGSEALEEKKHQVDEKLFLRNVRQAKLSGDWKESTPNSVLAGRRRTSLASDDKRPDWEGVNRCNHKYNSMPAKTSSFLMFRQYGSKRKSKNRKSICTIS